MCVCVCVCVREREREIEQVCVRVSERRGVIQLYDNYTVCYMLHSQNESYN